MPCVYLILLSSEQINGKACSFSSLKICEIPGVQQIFIADKVCQYGKIQVLVLPVIYAENDQIRPLYSLTEVRKDAVSSVCKRIMDGDGNAAGPELFDKIEDGTFSHIVHVGLVGYAENGDPGGFNTFEDRH